MIAVIGDIHGCFHTLEVLYEKVKKKYPDIDFYSVGDLVDRGRFSFEVVEFIRQNNIKFTAGNHEMMFYYFINHPAHPIGKSWIYNGCETTLQSYDGKPGKMREHLAFIKKAPLFIDLDDCFISHAGISSFYYPKIKKNILDEPEKLNSLLNDELNSIHGVIWSRDELINLGKLQIVGHTRYKDIYYNKKSNTLYIDTSAFSGNKLSAVVIEKNDIVDEFYVPTIADDI